MPRDHSSFSFLDLRPAYPVRSKGRIRKKFLYKAVDRSLHISVAFHKSIGTIEVAKWP